MNESQGAHRSRVGAAVWIAVVAVVGCSAPPSGEDRPASDAALDAIDDLARDADRPDERDSAAIDGSDALDAPTRTDATDAMGVMDVMDGATATDAAPYIDSAPRDRVVVDAAPRCYGITGTTGLLSHVAAIPRESGGSSNGATGCVGDVDNDGTREFVLVRMNEPSSLIGADFCVRGRVLLPEYARGCLVAEIDGDTSNGRELVVYGNDGWYGTGSIHVGRVIRRPAGDPSVEAFVWRSLWVMDERRHIAAFGAPHVAVTDLDRDGRPELAAAGNIPTGFVRAWELDPPGASRAWRSILDVDTSGVLTDNAGILSGDVDGDGDSEVVVPGSCGFRGNNHSIRVWQQWTSPPSVTNTDRPAQAVLADFDPSPGLEMAYARRTMCTDEPALDAGVPTPYTLEVRRFDTTSMTFVTMASTLPQNRQRDVNLVAAVDVEATPAPELVYCSVPSTGLTRVRTCRVFRYVPGATPSLADVGFSWSSPPILGGVDELIVDDLDNDGAKEIFLAGQEHVDVLRGPRR
ncbi:MAG: VCBS repeat-containing protein [Myxococcales bacterium]|nr:VCBS repeat-containing protein [Myxococcales bacterium]